MTFNVTRPPHRRICDTDCSRHFPVESGHDPRTAHLGGPGGSSPHPLPERSHHGRDSPSNDLTLVPCSAQSLSDFSLRGANGVYTVGPDQNVHYSPGSCDLPSLSQLSERSIAEALTSTIHLGAAAASAAGLSQPGSQPPHELTDGGRGVGLGGNRTEALRVLFVGDSLVEELALLLAMHAGHNSSTVHRPRECQHAGSRFRAFGAYSRQPHTRRFDVQMVWSAATLCTGNFDGLPLGEGWYASMARTARAFHPDVLVLSIPSYHLLYRCKCEEAAVCGLALAQKTPMERGRFCSAAEARRALTREFVARVSASSPNASLVFLAAGATFSPELESTGVVCNADLWREHRQNMQIVEQLTLPRPPAVLNLFDATYSFTMAVRAGVVPTAFVKLNSTLLPPQMPREVRAMYQRQCVERAFTRHCSCLGMLPLEQTELLLRDPSLRPFVVLPPCEAALRMLLVVLGER